MTDVVKGVSKVWDRLFDHRGFLIGEIAFTLREFEQKRKDTEVDNLFKAIEVITEIKDTEIDRLKQAAIQIDKINESLEIAVQLSDNFTKLEEKYKHDNTLEDLRSKRKIVWDKFMDDITSKYSEINTNYETKEEELSKLPLNEASTVTDTDKLLSLEDLHWLHNYIQKQNQNNDDTIWLHELIEGSEVILPKNEKIPRNEELDKRCKRLKEEQANRDYFKMTKNVDNKRRVLPEDTVGYQLKQMNRHLVAVFQFIMSVIAGFVFGFIGIELLIGNLDFGFRLLLGIICALTIALAELYFLAKKLNEDLQFEYSSENTKGIKLD
ncbi:unnamed protein product [Psylliodes chrysocephalus]|uniref:Biogenesis of lysosome-related organelles complex 1 subunit 5 n=1 Tax=Psylliodes chrysocephalus TaxID=3402493 RepID=A0A9P0GB40_9CUCU|nr:unnamed protein product [Psylliodes chrysocephala]